MMFRKLNAAQEQEFRKWARQNYRPGGEIKSVWHPIVQEECAKINGESLTVQITAKPNNAK